MTYNYTSLIEKQEFVKWFYLFGGLLKIDSQHT